MDEYWDLFDGDRHGLGIVHRRGEVIPEGMYHIVVHAWIMDHSGRFLISRRQKGRTDELLWERTGGSVLAGETSLEGALREVKEELGLDLRLCEHYFLKSEKRELRRDFYDSWLFLVDKVENYVTNEEEVLQWRWASLDDMRRLKEENLLVDTSEYFEQVYAFYRLVMERDDYFCE